MKKMYTFSVTIAVCHISSKHNSLICYQIILDMLLFKFSLLLIPKSLLFFLGLTIMHYYPDMQLNLMSESYPYCHVIQFTECMKMLISNLLIKALGIIHDFLLKNYEQFLCLPSGTELPK